MLTISPIQERALNIIYW